MLQSTSHISHVKKLIQLSAIQSTRIKPTFQAPSPVASSQHQIFQSSFENHSATSSDNQKITNDTAITLAASIKFFYWILFKPGFCHFMEASNHISLNNRVVGAIDSNIIARNHLQIQHKVPIISDTIDNFLLKWKPLKDLLVDGYYSSLDHAFTKVSLHTQLSAQATIINALQSQPNLGIFLIKIRSTIQEPINNFIKSLENNWTIYKADIDSTEFSDLVQSSFTLLTGVIKSSNLPACIPIIPPRKPNSFQQSLTPAFNKFQHAIIPLEEAFDVHQTCHTIIKDNRLSQNISKSKPTHIKSNQGFKYMTSTAQLHQLHLISSASLEVSLVSNFNVQILVLKKTVPL